MNLRQQSNSQMALIPLRPVGRSVLNSIVLIGLQLITPVFIVFLCWKNQ